MSQSAALLLLIPSLLLAELESAGAKSKPASRTLPSIAAPPADARPNFAGVADVSTDSAPATLATAYPIDLPTAFRLAEAQNPQIAFARERIAQAVARQEAANSLWLPSIRAGGNWAQHDGTIQETVGRVLKTDRYSLGGGLGVATFGAGPPMLPGISADFHFADAIFQPLAARQFSQARAAGASVATNDTLLEVAVAYLGLLSAVQEIAIADEANRNTRQLSNLTNAYAKTGQGLMSDADRVLAELSVRENDVVRADEGSLVASARLAQPLRLDPTLRLQPMEPAVVPLEFIQTGASVCDLIEKALAQRPEIAEQRGQIGEAAARSQREQFAPLVPTVSVGTSYSGFGGGENNGRGELFGDRTDVQAIAYWQVRNLGLGDQAARRDRRSQVRQETFRLQSVQDQVKREVAEAFVRVEARRKRIEIAQSGITSAVASHERNFARIKDAQGLPIEVLQSIQALALSRREYLRAVIEYNIAQFQLQRATGVFLGFDANAK